VKINIYACKDAGLLSREGQLNTFLPNNQMQLEEPALFRLLKQRLSLCRFKCYLQTGKQMNTIDGKVLFLN